MYEKCFEAAEATVISVTGTDKSRWRPAPLSTIEMQKLASRKLHISSDRLMDIAEKLYNKGFISYPRTETDSFSKNINLKSLIEIQQENPMWSEYPRNLIQNNMFLWPRNGGHDDKAHPPIHPVKLMLRNQNDQGISNDEFRVYELITRHFLASCSKDAKGFETVIKVEMQKEFFHAKGLAIKENNWLDIYIYEKWAATTLPLLKVGDKFTPSELILKDSSTAPPSLLTEAELIGLMDKNGIGTDATIHEHIKTIQERNYAEKVNGSFKPTKLGIALIRAYEDMEIDLWKPSLRAAMESNISKIAKGEMNKEIFLKGCLIEIKEIFMKMKAKSEMLFNAIGVYFTMNQNGTNISNGNGALNQDGIGNIGNQQINIENYQAIK